MKIGFGKSTPLFGFQHENVELISRFLWLVWRVVVSYTPRTDSICPTLPTLSDHKYPPQRWEHLQPIMNIYCSLIWYQGFYHQVFNFRAGAQVVSLTHSSSTTQRITMTSEWARWRLISPDSRLFTQAFILAQIKENIKAPRHWPLWGEFTGDRWIPRTKDQ